MKQSFSDFSLTIGKLMVAYFQGTITPSENDQLDQWVELSKDNLKIFEEFVEIASRNRLLQAAKNEQL